MTDATGRERLMTLKDYNIKENNVIAMVMKDHTTTNLNGYDENERIVFLFLVVLFERAFFRAESFCPWSEGSLKVAKK